MENTYILTPNGELYHHGVKGQKWGVRKYQNQNGELTAAGKKHRKQRDTAERSVKNGTRYVKKHDPVKIAAIISSSTAVASGALWVASAFIPGAPILNTVAAAASLISSSMALH